LSPTGQINPGAVPRTWVSATGSGSACTRAAPCATFQAAHNATDPGGEIDCASSGVFGGISINRSITVDCTGFDAVADASVTVSGAANLSVRLRGITFGTTISGPAVNFVSATLFIEKCSFLNDNFGINFFPGAPVTLSHLFVTDSSFLNGSGAAFIGPVFGASVHATVAGARVERSASIALQVGPASGVSSVHVRDSVIDGAATGLGNAATTAGVVSSVIVDRSSMRLNGTGVSATGAGAFVLVGRSTVMSNGTGLAVAGGGHIVSYQNNHLTGNAIDGAATSVVSVK